MSGNDPKISEMVYQIYNDAKGTDMEPNRISTFEIITRKNSEHVSMMEGS